MRIPFSDRHARQTRFWGVRICVLAAVILLCCAERAPGAGMTDKPRVLDSTLRLLQELRNDPAAPQRLRDVLQSPAVSVTMRVRPSVRLAEAELEQMESNLGVRFSRSNDRIVRIGAVYSARVPWEALRQLETWPGVERVDSIWKPAIAAPLDLSIPEIRGDQVWAFLDSAGWPLTGRGVALAVFDTGVDISHPDLWRADGGTYTWLDVNGNGLFDRGTDAVDLDRSADASHAERLDTIDSTSSGQGVPGTDDGQFRIDADWLYNDANANGRRDHGRADGYGETSPTYGERLFVADDRNHNGLLDTGESLLALGTCKVIKVLGPSATEYVRGANLVDCPLDVEHLGHGTQTCSVVAGGSPGLRRYTGVAPGAGLLVADGYHNEYTAYVPWAEANGAQVMLYEFGSWVQEFLDGSSNLEQMLDAESAKGIAQVVPAGNLASGGKHADVIVPGGASRSIGFTVPVGEGIEEAWLSILWRGADDAVTAQLMTPTGAAITLTGTSFWLELSGHRVWSALDRSSRGTVRLDTFVQRAGVGLTEGNWVLDLRCRSPGWMSVHSYAYDPGHEWAGGIQFLDHVDSLYTVASPATADSAIAVASYSVRGRAADSPGALSFFSGLGPRLDGENVLDVAAPGHYDIACAQSKDVPGNAFGQYGWFGGTSAAAAHVAGAAALLIQSNPRLRPDQVTQMLRESARQDGHTGIVPNNRWGWGKLDVLGALARMPTPSPTPRVRLLLPILLRAAHHH